MTDYEPDIIIVRAVENTKHTKYCEVSTNLTSYITAYRTYHKAFKDKHPDVNKYEQAFIEARTSLANEFRNLRSNFLWQRIEKNLNNLPEEQNDFMSESAVSQILSDDGFSEIFKNVIDNKIKSILNNHNNDTLDVKLHVIMDDETDPDCVSFTIKDFGSGFPTNILELTSKEKRKEYCSQPRHSEKAQDEISPYLGGRGLGLRQLIAKMDGTGKDYVMPEKSNLRFENDIDEDNQTILGAMITLTTSKKPLLLHSQAITSGVCTLSLNSDSSDFSDHLMDSDSDDDFQLTLPSQSELLAKKCIAFKSALNTSYAINSADESDTTSIEANSSDESDNEDLFRHRTPR